jgi:hypothetical protein
MFEGYCVTDTEKAKDIPSIMTIPLFKDKSLRFNMGHVIIPYLRIINHIMTDGSYRFELSSEKPVCIYESFKKIVRVEEFEEYITKHQDKTKKEEV